METKETSASKKSWSHNNKLCKWVSTSQDKNNREMMMLWKKKEGAQKIVEPSLPKVEARVSSSIKSGAKSFCWRVEGIGSISSGYATGNAILPLMSVSRRVCLQQVSHFHFTLQYAHQETEYGIKSTVYVNWLQIRWLFLSLEWHPLSHTIYILFNVYPEVSSSRFPVWEEHLLTWSPGQQSCRRRQSSLAKKWWSVMIVMKWVTAAHSCEVAFWCNFWWNFWRNFNLKEETSSSSSDSACLSLFFVFFCQLLHSRVWHHIKSSEHKRLFRQRCTLYTTAFLSRERQADKVAGLHFLVFLKPSPLFQVLFSSDDLFFSSSETSFLKWEFTFEICFLFLCQRLMILCDFSLTFRFVLFSCLLSFLFFFCVSTSCKRNIPRNSIYSLSLCLFLLDTHLEIKTGDFT